MSSARRIAAALLTLAVLLSAGTSPRSALAAQLSQYHDFEQAFGYDGKKPPAAFTAQLVRASSPAGVFWPGEEASFTFQILNNTDMPLKAAGRWELVQYATHCMPQDPLSDIHVAKVKDCGTVPASVDIPARGFVRQTVKLPLPQRFGAYAVVLALDHVSGGVNGGGRQLAATCVRAMRPRAGKVQFPSYACDVQRAELAPVFQRIGLKGTRQEWGYFNPGEPKNWEKLDQFMKAMSENEVTVLLTISTGGDGRRMPMGVIRGFPLNDKAEGKMEYPGDFCALPQYDQDFQKWVRAVAERYGWPRGPLNAVELWNEPWEGISISGWGADMLRYRDLYARMAEGVEEARKEAGVQVLIGGTCSSMNTEDKLFPDGNDEPFLKWLDFTSIHYQPMCAEPALVRRYLNRKDASGRPSPVRVWDTESWIANSEDRVAGVLASMRALGQERTAGVNHDQVRSVQEIDVRQDDGKTTRAVSLQALAPAAAIAATQNFMGQRPFKEVLFKNGLPWVFVFDGLDGHADDGTVVVVGDLGAFYDRDLLLFRNVLGLEARKRSDRVRPKLAALAPDAPAGERSKLLDEVKLAEVLDSASLTLSDGGGRFVSYDFYGNPTPADADHPGRILVPLNGFGYFLRTDGSPGSFAKLLDAIRAARIDGYEPVDVAARDLTGRIESGPALRLTITNILNRPLSGRLEVKLGDLPLDRAAQDLKLAPHETRELSLRVSGGKPAADNTYPLTVTYDAGADGRKIHREAMHVNVIPRRTIDVDGNLEDWKDVPPQPIRSAPGAGANLTERAWLPFGNFDAPGARGARGVASGFLAYDDRFFYFAAKIADATPYEGNVRFERRDDDSYFYPDVVWDVRRDDKTHKETRREELHWPPGVRHYSYRRDFDVPSGDSTDNVQIAFNVLPIEQSDFISHPPGTMPRFMCYKTTDYEYALNTVANKYGGGTEIWRLFAPGIPRKHYFPRQPKAPRDGGPVHDGKLVTRRDGNTRLVECALPWSEIPDVRKRLDAGEPIKFTFRVNDNKGPGYELNAGRSVSKIDTYALHNYWSTSWAVETEFAFEK